jgi:DNA-binding transcriptional regulator YiaG
VAGVERRFARLKARVLRTGVSAGPGRPLTPQSIRSLRERLGMPRVEFAKLLGVSPGSIFGWETGRTLPRGRSVARLREVRKMGVRAARDEGGKGRKVRRGRRRSGRRGKR